jgi:hypothetical protein
MTSRHAKDFYLICSLSHDLSDSVSISSTSYVSRQPSLMTLSCLASCVLHQQVSTANPSK